MTAAKSENPLPGGAPGDDAAKSKTIKELCDEFLARPGVVLMASEGPPPAASTDDGEGPPPEAGGPDSAAGAERAVFRIRSENHRRLLERQFVAVVEIQQWPRPERRKMYPNAEDDSEYEFQYLRWKRYLDEDSASGKSICEYYGADFLRSLILVNGAAVKGALKKINSATVDIPAAFGALVSMAGIAEQDAIELLPDAPETAGLRSDLASETGLGFLARDYGGAKEEGLGIISFQCITNDREPEHLMKLITIKNIFARQLPKMPREYIVRLVLDRNHFTFCLLKQNTVVGGVCFRPYFTQRFAEIAFLAITSSEQVKGYGTRLMNHLKEHVKRAKIEYFLTYADNFAIGYFRKQGFSAKIEMPKERWYGYIKDYDGGTLMECYINPNVNYLRLSEKLREQKRLLKRVIGILNPPTVHPGIKVWDETKPLEKATIPGLVEAGWQDDGPKTRKEPREAKTFQEQLLAVLDILYHHENAWPFRKPVLSIEAPDYYEVIKRPMDISTIRKKIKSGEYQTKQQYVEDLKLMLDNCRLYNHPSTIYYKYAQELEMFILPKLEQIAE